MKVLHNHFGSRARLIKLESIFQSLNQEIDNANRTIQDMTSSKVLVKAKAKLRYLFSTLMHEHLEYETLNKIYNGELNLPMMIKMSCWLFGEKMDFRLQNA